MLLIPENIRKTQNSVAGNKALQNTSGDFCYAEDSDLKKLDAFPLCAELFVWMDVDAERASRFFLNSLR